MVGLDSRSSLLGVTVSFNAADGAILEDGVGVLRGERLADADSAFLEDCLFSGVLLAVDGTDSAFLEDGFGVLEGLDNADSADLALLEDCLFSGILFDVTNTDSALLEEGCLPVAMSFIGGGLE